jgi:hypothetical protein
VSCIQPDEKTGLMYNAIFHKRPRFCLALHAGPSSRSGPILSAKLVESRTNALSTVYADSLPARGTHRFSWNRTRPDDFRHTGLLPARFNQQLMRQFKPHESEDLASNADDYSAQALRHNNARLSQPRQRKQQGEVLPDWLMTKSSRGLAQEEQIDIPACGCGCEETVRPLP